MKITKEYDGVLRDMLKHSAGRAIIKNDIYRGLEGAKALHQATFISEGEYIKIINTIQTFSMKYMPELLELIVNTYKL